MIPPPAVLLLAAGQGKRMKSVLPKVLHEICGEPLLIPILRSIDSAFGTDAVSVNVGIIVGHGREKVEAAVRSAVKEDPTLRHLKVDFILQAEQKGTGHAVHSAMESTWGSLRLKEKANVLVLPGDSPLIPPALVGEIGRPLEKNTAIRLLTCDVPDPRGYGRVLRLGFKAAGKVKRIVEEKDASPRERKITEVAASIYLFQSTFLANFLPKLTTKNAQGEYYLTDLIEWAGKGTAASRTKVSTLAWANAEDLRGVNDLWELSLAERALQLRLIERHARNGVRFLDPSSVAIEASVVIGERVRIERGAILRGHTTIGNDVEIGSNVVLKNMRIGNSVELKTGSYCLDSVVESGAKIGPYAHLRPDSLVGKGAKIGNFVELKKSKIGENTSIAHLSYVGDAAIGARVNIGCGFITCNFDGRSKKGSRKHETVIEDDAFIGSDCQTVAPVKVGRGAYVASGSTITLDVEAGSLAIARSRQENKIGYAKKFRPE
ncbi:MAG: bifunctional UDP-N-acetylglucosamine diphosphorylase/glucosamine-1-phosphate N-acetyltransferase GlmU [Cryobacterium sp.]|nr:bifunctional UDP-N-acetylglucosamine diphosphorylase/glucosamine-1-phosphate N-acetyltransferase GlmU [Oligoflexia bacterium]